jgi:PAS domain-containing protein
MLEAANVDVTTARAQAATSAAQARAMLESASDGIAVIDGTLQLAASNSQFAAACGLDAGILRVGLPLDELLRQLGSAGRFGELDDLEVEVTRRIGLLRSDASLIALDQIAPDGAMLTLRSHPTPDGGLVLILNRASGPAPLVAEEPIATAPVEW